MVKSVRPHTIYPYPNLPLFFWEFVTFPGWAGRCVYCCRAENSFLHSETQLFLWVKLHILIFEDDFHRIFYNWQNLARPHSFRDPNANGRTDVWLYQPKIRRSHAWCGFSRKIQLTKRRMLSEIFYSNQRTTRIERAMPPYPLDIRGFLGLTVVHNLVQHHFKFSEDFLF